MNTEPRTEAQHSKPAEESCLLSEEEARRQRQRDQERRLRRRQKETEMHVGPRYALVKLVGYGAYGVVWSARDTTLPVTSAKGNVAIKKIMNPFDHPTDSKRLLREIMVLRDLNHSNILANKDLLCPPDSQGQFSSLYIVTELMDTDLHKIIQSQQTLSDQHIQYFLYQILRGLKYLHSAGILHRDLKPGNILLNENCGLKIGDFGLARAIPRDDPNENDEVSPNFLTQYVVTRWYRAPELLLQEKHYTTAVDVWSVGCILAEMFGRTAIFQGNSYIDVLANITNVVGTPTPEECGQIGVEQARNFVCTLEPKPPASLRELYPNANPSGLELLQKMLTFNFHHRISILDCLTHPYMSDLHDPDDEPTADHIFAYEYNDNSKEMTKYKFKELIFQQVVLLHPECLPQLQSIREQHREMFQRQAQEHAQMAAGLPS
eukprot:NODE_1429_length_1508_cov_156.283128_g1354_i0.p1 GENE.NODE_1429_length_1508_cov_156.283128_g1354_i0~~NODE_1429_length_1508_cov_156.283128_g1354_i0.p1  ORF type:complete len:454 (+),score=86.48 NODE_1429_length_1508_cov_156.283128_g1354_i0:63-1364(+)